MFIGLSNDCYKTFVPYGILSEHVIFSNDNKSYKSDICKK